MQAGCVVPPCSSIVLAPPAMRSLRCAAPQPFDLFYFDGLAQQDEVIRLTVAPGTMRADPGAAAVSRHRDMTPPIDHVIRTKWKRATVDWHDVEPLL